MTKESKLILASFLFLALVLMISTFAEIYERKHSTERYKMLYEESITTTNELQVTNEALRDSLLNIHIDYQRCLNIQARRETR